MMTLDPAGLEAAAKVLCPVVWDSRDAQLVRIYTAQATDAVRAYLAASPVPPDGKTLSREFDEDGRALCFQCGEPQSAHPDGEECEGREYARGFAAGRAAATPDPPDAAIDSAFVAGLQKHDGGLWELAFAAGRGAERERIVAALEADYRANVADGADGIYTDGLHDAWRLTVRRAKRDDLIKPVSGSSEPRKETT